MTNEQNVILSIYKAFSKICEENDIRYFAFYGTAIGAVRHHGFIPWDDDLDIVIPDSDYDKMISALHDNLPEYYHLRQNENDSCFVFFDKIEDVRTTKLEEKELCTPEVYKGIWIDLFKLSGIPNNHLSDKTLNFITKIFTILRSRNTYTFKYVNTKKKITMILTYPFRLFFTIDRIVSIRKKIFERCSSELSEYVYDPSEPCSMKNKFKREWFESYVEMQFEDTTIRVPSGYNDLLTTMYGDYMVLPDEKDRINHSDGGITDLEKSYKWYQTDWIRNH